MRTVALLGWLMVPVLVGAYHYGPGQEKVLLDEVSGLLAQADALAQAGHFERAAEVYGKAIGMIPADRPADARRARLERAKAQMFARQLPEAAADLKLLVEELEVDKSTDPKLLADAQAAQANAQYYLTWLMRLEGLTREEWEPEIDSARQTYRLLAERATEAGDSESAGRHAQDLESVIRLARMEPGDLQGLPIPKQCQNCKSGQCKNPGKRPGRNNKGEGKPKDARGASAGPPPDGSGS